MSIATWRAEFYPVEASTVSKEDALAHSLRKWEGARSSCLRQHEVTRVDGFCLVDDTGDSFEFSGETCALCRVHASCEGCPVDEAERNCNDHDSPYEEFLEGGSPVPMINLLKELRQSSITDENVMPSELVTSARTGR